MDIRSVKSLFKRPEMVDLRKTLQHASHELVRY